MNVLEMFSLKGKVAVITGGSGLYGRQIVEACAEAGATTIMASRDLEKLKATAKDFEKKGLKVNPHSLDQGNEESIKRLRSEVLDRYGRVDVLINNSFLRPMQARTYDPAAWRKSMDVNATGLYMITELFAEPMMANRSGNILNVSSIQGNVGVDPTLYEGLEISGFYPDYFFHKAGMVNFTRFYASYLGPYNIRVNCISPGGFFNNQPAEFVKRYSARTFLGRMANDQDLKGVIVFLASEASAYITGENIMVDAGYTAK
jgi:NAD(P)-dependent dehydrogenase (short-subunit alcohol dehydrogenase family)